MIALIQRVRGAQVVVDEQIVGKIDTGLLALVAVERGDGAGSMQKLLDKILKYRVFADGAGKMNLSLRDTGGGLLLVSQFTLAADTNSGLRPSFTPAASPEDGRHWFDALCNAARSAHPIVETGVFGAHMQVSLCNDGPVTFWLRSAP